MEDLLDGVPYGIVMFLGTVFAAAARVWRRKAAKRAYPELAERLGLKWLPPVHRHGAGTLRGVLGNRRVLVESDERARVVVEFRSPIPVDLRSYSRWKRAPEGLSQFFFGERTLDAWLQGRFATDQLIPRLIADKETRELLKATRQEAAQRELTVDRERIEVRLDFGKLPYIPEPQVEAWLGRLGRLAERIESLDSSEASTGYATLSS